MIGDTARKLSRAPVWALERPASSRFPRIPVWLACVAFGLLLILLVVRQATGPGGYYYDDDLLEYQDAYNDDFTTSSGTTTTTTAKAPSSWVPANWSPSSLFGLSGSTKTTPETEPTTSLLSANRTLRIVITENISAHDEVVAPLITAFGSLPGANITAILLSKMDRYGSFEMFRNLHIDSPNPIPTPKNYRSSDLDEYLLNNPPDILVCTTCTQDSFEKYQWMLEETETHIFCTVHHAEKWSDNYMFGVNEKRLADWVAADRLDFITLSPHVTKAMPEQLRNWAPLKHKAILPPVHTFPPVFAVDMHPLASKTNTSISIEPVDQISFALQGNYEPERRNFTQVFAELAELKTVLENDTASYFNLPAELSLHLVGSGQRPPVPANVQDSVVFDEQLNFTDFYTVLSQMTAILPAFANPSYFTLKASSTIPAALIAGAPIVASPAIMASYGYLEESGVWLQKENETDFDVLKDIVRASKELREAKRKGARELGKKLVAQGKADVREWVEAVLQRKQERRNWFGGEEADAKVDADADDDAAIHAHADEDAVDDVA